MTTDTRTIKDYFERMMRQIYKDRLKQFEGMTKTQEGDITLCKSIMKPYFKEAFPAIVWEWSAMPGQIINVLGIV